MRKKVSGAYFEDPKAKMQFSREPKIIVNQWETLHSRKMVHESNLIKGIGVLRDTARATKQTTQ